MNFESQQKGPSPCSGKGPYDSICLGFALLPQRARAFSLHVFHHFPNSARADPSTESAANAFAFLDDVLERFIRKFLTFDSAVVAGLLAHTAVAAGTTGHAAIRFLFRREL